MHDLPAGARGAEGVRDPFRRGELRLGERDLTDDQIVDLMVEHPDLIQRPIVEKGSRAILARPAERLKEIL